jgi:hypothetical protein
MVDEEVTDDEKVKVADLTVADATARLADERAALSSAVNWQNRLTRIRAKLEGRLAALPKRPSSHEQQTLRGQLAAAITDVTDGVRHADGVSIHIELDIAGKPGLDEITKEIPRRKKNIRILKRYLDRWPNEAVTHPYRFKGSTGLTFFDGRELEKGAVVNLTRGQASNMRDRFEEITEASTHAKAS